MNDWLDDLHAAADGLQAATARLDRALIDKNVRAFIRLRVGDTATDILDAVVVLDEAHRGAVAATDEEARRLFEAMPSRLPPPDAESWSLEEHAEWLAAQPTPTPEQWAEVGRVMGGEVTRTPYAKAKVAYKAMLFFVRAHQDALYRAFLEARGERAGPKTTMSSGLKEGKPLATLLNAELPSYLDWFSQWRTRRNDVKDGVSVGFTGVGGFGLVFHTVTDEGGVVAQWPAFSLGDVVEAVSLSGEAVEAVARYIVALGR